MGNYSEIIGIETIMQDYGLSRPYATRLLNDPNCKTLPRSKGQPYRVTRDNWEKFINQ